MERHRFERREFRAHKGDALVWSSNVVHGGSPVRNPSMTRRSQVTHYFFEGCLFYTPMLSDAPRGEMHVRRFLVDVRTGERPVRTVNGLPVALGPLPKRRSRVYVDPSLIDRLTVARRSAAAKLAKRRGRLKESVALKLRRWRGR